MRAHADGAPSRACCWPARSRYPVASPAMIPAPMVPANLGDCLPPLTFTNQHGNQISLASLKGRPVLVDFIYTTCPGACLMLTQKMVRIAAGLPAQSTAPVTLVSITIDPEHDGPGQLAAYARKQGAESRNWLFLTGPPATVEDELAVFAVRRERKPTARSIT